MSTQEETKRTPTPGCRAAADYLVDFETLDGVSNAFKQSLEDMPSEADAIAALARHINNATAASLMLETLQEADGLLGYFHWDSPAGRTDKFEMVQKIRAAINAALRKE
jgi:hypothetical protein